MDIHERLKYLRKLLNLTTRSFGASINMSGGAITNMENGTRNITDRTIRDICREHNVNPTWLLTGTGAIFNEVDSIESLDISDEVKQLTKQYLLLDDQDKVLIQTMISSLLSKIENTDH